MSDITASAFKTAIVMINPVALAIFFDEICKIIFNYLLSIESDEDGVFKLMLIYFGTIKTKSRDMTYFYCLVLLKVMINLFNFQGKI